MNFDSEVWALTSYFNPLKYERRVTNYHTFRNHLTVPLVTVELIFGQPDLSASDADIYVGLDGGAMLWQKERLLNIALKLVPPHVRYIAWLDCDIIFTKTNWAAELVESLQQFRMVQLFAHMYDLKAETNTPQVPSGQEASGVGIARLMAEGNGDLEHFRPRSTFSMRRALFGLAWGAERKLIDKHGFYDAMIIGSGDRAMVCAAAGRMEDSIATAHLNAARSAHYSAWGTPFYQDVQGKLGFLSGDLIHCWHGEITDRRYLERHQDFEKQEFDPMQDICLTDNGLWTWTEAGIRHQQFMRDYFSGRREGNVRIGPNIS